MATSQKKSKKKKASKKKTTEKSGVASKAKPAKKTAKSPVPERSSPRDSGLGKTKKIAANRKTKPVESGEKGVGSMEELCGFLEKTLNRHHEKTLDEIKEIHEGIASLAPLPIRVSADGDLEGGVHALRRFLSEWLEARMESVMSELVTLRAQAASSSTDPKGLLLEIDNLLERLGAVKYQANRLDYVDPLIHIVAGERFVEEAPNGVIMETLQPGFRSGRGIVLVKAHVAVNRRQKSGTAGY